jgi:endonuclease/exonuclease/phosphatase (EEP) superfamily protein YafD
MHAAHLSGERGTDGVDAPPAATRVRHRWGSPRSRRMGQTLRVDHTFGVLLRGCRLTMIALSWTVVIGLAIVSAFHLLQSEPSVAFVALIAVTPWIYMLAWASALVGLFTGHRVLAGVSVVLVGLQLWWVLPDFDPISHVVRPPRGAAEVRVFDENVSWDDFNLSGIGREIRRYQPDVVVLQEPNPTALASLQKAGALSRFHYDLVKTNVGSNGMAIYSVFPLEDVKIWYAGPVPQFRAWLGVPGGRRLRLDAIHLHAPIVGYGQPALWAAEMVAVRKELAGEPRPLIAVGDFGGTWYNAPFQSLLHLGLRDAAVVAGQGWRMTWPRSVVPVVRIDHVLLSPSVSLEAYALGSGQGTDHRPIMATVSVGGVPSP